MKHAFRTWASAAALLLAGASLAAVVPSAHAAEAGSAGEPPPELETLRAEGFALHDAALEGDESAAEQAARVLGRYLKRLPEDGEARAYLGSAYAMMARDASSVANKVRYANRGLRHLDRALEAAPRAFVVRMIRANVNSSLPEMFKRADAALADMLALDEIYRAEPSPGLAREMVGIYPMLQARAPDAGPWAERLRHARALSQGQ